MRMRRGGRGGSVGHVMHKPGDLLQLRHEEAARLPLQVERGDAFCVGPAQQDGGELGQALPTAHRGVDQVLEQPHHGDLPTAGGLVPLPVEVSVADTEHGRGCLHLTLHPLAGVLHAGRVVTAGSDAIPAQSRHQVLQH